MRLEYRVVVAAFAFWGCASPTAENEASLQFGKLKAKLNGSDFVGAFGPDSVIAIWDTVANQMQIEGGKQVRGRLPLLRFRLRCAQLPKPGNYAVQGMLSPVNAEALLEPTALQRLWPVHGVGVRGFLSDSMPAGKLVLDTVDSASGVIRGRFTVSLRSVNRIPAETLDVRGAFFGRLRISPRFARPRVGWAPMFETDCERIRNSVSM